MGDAASILAAGAVLSPGDWQDDVRFPIDAHVKVRSRTPAAPATIAEERDADGATRLVARFVDPLRAVAPGQIAVAYEGDRVLGGATILAALEASA